MARPKPNAQLTAYLKNQRKVDAELRKVLIAAANDARRQLNALNPTRSNEVRRAQLALQEAQLRAWAKVGTIIEEGIQSNAAVVAEVNRLFTDDMLRRNLGVTTTDAFRQQLLAQANNTVRTYLAREHHGIALSERVYRNGAVASGKIERIINNGILRGASARELARDVARYINPNTPGGASYAAMRLARSELNNSFHQAAIDSAASNPFVEKMSWKLSGSHPKTDICDSLVGTYRIENVPPKPHPQCFCYLEPETISRAELISNFKAGAYDEWADSVA